MRFQDPDAAFHARRAERAIRAGALLPPTFDRFENFPEGGRAVWPPLHDATLALAARLAGSTPAEPRRGMSAAAALPVLQLVLAVGAASALAAHAGGPAGAGAAALLFAATPTTLVRGGFGEIDHNMTEVLGALALLLIASRAARAEGSRAWIGAGAWAVALLLALGFHTGLLLSAAVAGAAALAAAFVERRSGAAIAGGFALAAGALPFFAGLRVAPDPGDPWRLGPVYALALAIGAIGCAGVTLPLNALRSLGGDFGLSTCALAAALVVLLSLPRAAWGGLLRGLGFLGARDPWLASIQEFQPAWRNPAALEGLLPVLFGAAAALVLAARARPARPHTAGLLLVGAPLAVFLVLGVLQQRFLALAGAFGATAFGAAFGLLASRRARLAAGIAAAAGLIWAGPMVARSLRSAWRAEADRSLTAPEVVALVLREKTADPGDPPAWGVLAPWDFGHAILRDSGRAVALDNFGSWHPGFEEKMRLYVETSPHAAADALTRLRLRYVVAPFPPPVLHGVANALGKSPSSWIFDAADQRPGLYRGTPEGERTLLFRLHKGEAAPDPGDGPADAAALRRFRKVWESPERTPESGPLLKLFELLPEAPP